MLMILRVTQSARFLFRKTKLTFNQSTSYSLHIGPKMDEDNGNFEWSFGFGSNMDPAFMESSKGLKVKPKSWLAFLVAIFNVKYQLSYDDKCKNTGVIQTRRDTARFDYYTTFQWALDLPGRILFFCFTT